MNRAWMRDPLRAGMEARVRGTQRLALGAALTLAFFALALKLCAAMEGAAVIALVGAGCAALLLAGAWRALREEPVIVLLCAALLAMLAVAAHLAMLDIKPGRMSKVLAPMLEGMWNYDLGTAMAWEDGAWSGGYLIVMALISRLEAFPQMYAVKLFDMACQTAAALFYIANEALSIIENCGLMGLPVPAFLRKLLEVLRDKSDQSEDKYLPEDQAGRDE